MKITIDQRHCPQNIEEAKTMTGENCPVAMAILEQVGLQVLVMRSGIHFKNKVIANPKELFDFINTIDCFYGQCITIAQFSFPSFVPFSVDLPLEQFQEES